MLGQIFTTGSLSTWKKSQHVKRTWKPNFKYVK